MVGWQLLYTAAVPDKSQEELLAAECWSNRSEQLTSARVEPQTFVLENSQLYCQRANGCNEDMGERFNKKNSFGWVGVRKILYMGVGGCLPKMFFLTFP